MGRNRNKRGAVVENYKGFNIRMMIAEKTDEKTKRQTRLHTGKFGIYTGKNLKQEVKKVADAYPIINKMIAEKPKA